MVRHPFFHAPDTAEPLSLAGMLTDLLALFVIMLAVAGAMLCLGGLAG
ncbi:hypothetical protein [Chelativorans oligotrophicus]|nr:hypothetical protein [Chelativorans oligotrophicus]